jgi:hypothetical protein
MSLETAFIAMACILVTLCLGVLLILHVIRKVEKGDNDREDK